MSAPLTQQDTLNSDLLFHRDPTNTEKTTGPHAPSTRPLMSENQGRTASMYTHQGPELTGGGALGRQISVQLTPEQFEKLYLQPGGMGAPRQEDFTKRFGNPTVLGLAVFLVTLTPLSCYFMGFMGSTTDSALTLMGTLYFSAGLGLYLSAILEWLIGNTFPFVVFGAFGGFYLSFAYLIDPMNLVATSLAAAPVQYNNGISLWLIFWGILTFVFFMCSLRTNVVFVFLFLSVSPCRPLSSQRHPLLDIDRDLHVQLDFAFWMLAAAYAQVSRENVETASRLFK
ncbi:hypothetical protein QFC20_003056 [Naganishia adeliensis]|uniref:Uncharacterized protein n=1 Tax=Naganishia adeliensis TaxID=92952 RepID=A0ACC2WGB3_9TREE|nr:hypothetical protein QFC20_003056 [Naganishia adeliensis]